MNRGYVKLWRKSIDAGWLKNHKLWAFWSYCLIKASHKEYDVIVGFQTVHLMPGEFIFGLNASSKELRMSIQSLRTCISYLKGSQNITVKVTNKYSIISIVNWDTYQGGEDVINNQNNTQLTSQQQATNKQLTTNKNVKNVKKRSSTLRGLFFDFETRSWIGISDQDKEGWKAAYPACEIEIELAGMAEWLLSNPDKRKTQYRRFITNWLKRSQDKGGTIKKSPLRVVKSKYFGEIPEFEVMR